MIDKVKFADVNLEDSFFDSLRNDYDEFVEWFEKKSKSGTEAFILKNKDGNLLAFLYMKLEKGELNDITPIMLKADRLKVGTFKVEGHDTRLGECFIKKIFDTALELNVDEIYVTIFKKHSGLIRLLERYGFIYYGTKGTGDKQEEVLFKKMNQLSETKNLLMNYPYFKSKGAKKYILSVYPLYHTRLFPNSILKTEVKNKEELIQDVSYTNSIQKIYLAKMNGLNELKPGDILVIYRTKDYRCAEYSSVITSLCIVQEIKFPKDFKSEKDFIKYTNSYSIFNENELKSYYNNNDTVVIKMNYVVAFNRKITRNELITDDIISRTDYVGFLELKDEQFNSIISKVGINESIIIDKA